MKKLDLSIVNHIICTEMGLGGSSTSRHGGSILEYSNQGCVYSRDESAQVEDGIRAVHNRVCGERALSRGLKERNAEDVIPIALTQMANSVERRSRVAIWQLLSRPIEPYRDLKLA